MQLSVPKKMVKQLCSSFIFNVTMSHSNAQENAVEKKSQFKKLILPGFVYEHGLSDKKYTLTE
jgi:hypothetical protein